MEIEGIYTALTFFGICGIMWKKLQVQLLLNKGVFFMMQGSNGKNDFSKGAVWKNIVSLAVPLTIAQLVQLCYNIVDRIYIGHLPGASSLALTGLGLTFPIITIITAFTNLFGSGGAPLCSIARGEGNEQKAQKIMGNSFFMLVSTGVILMVLCMIFQKPVLYMFGASDETYPYASAYLSIYLLGTIFVMIGIGMNNFINAQGFGRTGMMAVLVGAVINIILDPVFIFIFNLGVQGAAIATVISQFVSAVWVLKFLTGKKALFTLKLSAMKPDWQLIGRITGLGLSGFTMSVTNGLTQIACNRMLGIYGGDSYIAIMTVLNSVREIFMLPLNGTTNGAQPVLGFNYGAKEYGRVRQGVRFTAMLTISYTVIAWIVIMLIPGVFIRMFSSDLSLLDEGVRVLKIFFFGFFMMAFQVSGQVVFVGLGKSRQAVFFSLLRKVFIVVPLTLLLPGLWGLGVDGVFLAEPISNFVGGLACFLTMYFTVYRRMKKEELAAKAEG